MQCNGMEAPLSSWNFAKCFYNEHREMKRLSRSFERVVCSKSASTKLSKVVALFVCPTATKTRYICRQMRRSDSIIIRTFTVNILHGAKNNEIFTSFLFFSKNQYIYTRNIQCHKSISLIVAVKLLLHSVIHITSMFSTRIIPALWHSHIVRRAWLQEYSHSRTRNAWCRATSH